MVTIETINYFGDNRNSSYNTNVLYRKYGKLYLARVFVDFFNRSIYYPKQVDQGKVLKGLHDALLVEFKF